MILTLSGQKQSGKDTVASFLKDFGFQRIALADPLKELCSGVFHIPLHYFNDSELKEKALGPTPNYIALSQYWAIVDFCKLHTKIPEKIKPNEKISYNSPREILQKVGTDIIRNHIDPDLWIKIAINKVKGLGHWVVTDCRFPNERDIFRTAGATLGLVLRPGLNNSDAHASETMLGNTNDYDIVFMNNGSVSDLRRDVTMWATLRKIGRR